MPWHPTIRSVFAAFAGYAGSMDRIAQQVAPGLDTAGKKYTPIKNGRLRIPLPDNFGTLEVGAADEDDTIVGLVDSDWHTHGDVLQGFYFSGAATEVEAIISFIKAIFAGQLALIEEQWSGKKSRMVCFDLEQYLQGVPKDAVYKIFNK